MPVAVGPPRRAPRWGGLLQGVPASDVPLGSVVTAVAKGEVVVRVGGKELLASAFGVVFGFVGGGAELHVYEQESAVEPLTVLSFRRGTAVHWKDTTRGVLCLVSRGEDVSLELGLSASSWFSGLSQVLKGVVCDKSVESVMSRCGLPESLAPSLARNGFETLRFLRNASSKDLKLAGLSSSQAKALLSEAKRTPLLQEMNVSVPKTALLEEEIGQTNTAFREAFYSTKLQQIEAELRSVQRERPPTKQPTKKHVQGGREAEKMHREAAKERIAALLRFQGQDEGEAEKVLEQHSGCVTELINTLAAKAAGLAEGTILPPVLSLAYPKRPNLSGDYLQVDGEERQGMPVWRNSKGALVAAHESGRWAVHVGAGAADRGVAMLLSDKHYGAFPHVPGVSWLSATPDGWVPVEDFSISAAAESDRDSDRNPTMSSVRSGSEGRIVDDAIPIRPCATPAPSVAGPLPDFSEGERVEVRDTEEEYWVKGKVQGFTAEGTPLVLVDGWENPSQWKEVRRADPSAEGDAEGGKPPSPSPDVLEAVPPSPEEEVVLPSPPPALPPHMRKVLELQSSKGWKVESKEKHKGTDVVWESLPVSWSKMNAGRFSTIVECSLHTLVKFLENPENMKQWDKSLQKVEILEDIETEGAITIVSYMAMRIPPIQGRDMVSLTSSCLLTPEEAYDAGLVASVAEGGVSGPVFHRTAGAKRRGDEFAVEELSGNVFMIGSVSSDHARGPVDKKYVRADVHAIGICAVPVSQSRTKVVLIASVDPGGKLPAWAVNVAQRDQMKKLVALKKIVDGKSMQELNGKSL
eukprot:Hpha_TRINITY_DN15222_c5_g13::TRINITY_DN15222_c5_g13_i1::g.66875::m.66875